MKPYNLDTVFNFGKYDGQTLEEVFSTDPQYVVKCLTDVEDFTINEVTLQTLLQEYPETEIPSEAISNNLEKLDNLDEEDGDDFREEELFDDDLDQFDELSGTGKKGDEFGDFDDEWDDSLDNDEEEGEDDDY